MRASMFAVAALPLATALPTYTIPEVFKALFNLIDGASTETTSATSASITNSGADCTTPGDFEIEQFQVWTPDAGNNKSQIINFAYWDNTTDLQTICHYNATSKNVGPADGTARWACENPNVEFIWEEPTLTVIEKACPDSGVSAQSWEAAGMTSVNLTCTATPKNSTDGCGKDCFSMQTFIYGNFASFEPTPKS